MFIVTLAMWCQVLQEAYAEVTQANPSLSDPDLKARLARLILDAYAEGEDDPVFLKRIALVRLTCPEKLTRH